MGKLLPENWVEVQFAILLESLETGSRPKGGVQNIMEGIPSIGGEHLNSHGGFNFDKIKFIPKDYAVKIKRGLIKNNDILIVKDGATTGKTSFVDDTFPYEISFVNEHVFLCRVKEIICPKCIYYFLRSSIGQQRLLDNFAGAAQGGINMKFSTNTLIPLPPLAEQSRITVKLDILFGQLESIRKITDSIPLLLKDYRRQILNNAISGKLINGESEKKSLGEFLSDVKYGTSKKADYNNGGIPIFRIPNIVNGEIDDRDIKFTVLSEKEYEQLKLKEGDILIIRSNGSVSLVGQSAIVRKEFEKYAYAGYLIRLRCKEQLDPEFLNYSLKSDFCRNQVIEFAHSMNGINNINAEQIRTLKVLIYPLEIQKKIVKKVKCLFAKTTIIEQLYIKLKQKIDVLPQAILHKAFKGELVEQLPTDGSAADLLKEIEELKKTLQKK